MKNVLVKLSAVITILLLVTACGNNEQEANESESQLQIVTSIFPMYEIIREITGDRATVSLMVGLNEDAHHYEPSAQAVASVNDADLFLYSSDEMEFWVPSLLDVVESEKLEVIEFGEEIDFAIGEDAHAHADDDHNHDHGGMDPHFWLNPNAIVSQLGRVVTALTTIDADGAEVYQENAEAFKVELLILHEAYTEAFEQAEHRVFVVQHQAFGHLAHAYHLEQVAVGGLTTEVEPDPKQLAEIVDFVKGQKVPVVYYQSGENSAIAETIAAETNTETAVLYDLESTPLGEPDITYIEAMYENLEQLKKSIQ